MDGWMCTLVHGREPSFDFLFPDNSVVTTLVILVTVVTSVIIENV